MKRLLILAVIILIALGLLWTATTSSSSTPTPVFLNAQKGGGRQPFKFKGPIKAAPGPAASKDVSTTYCKAGDEKCAKAMAGGNKNCEAGDAYCVFAKGATGRGCVNTGLAKLCVMGPPKGGVQCKYTDKDCLKAIPPAATQSPPPSSSVGDVLEACTDTTLEQCADTARARGSCVHYTCKTKEDAQRINANNAQLVCKRDQVLKCDTEGNTAFCGCLPYYLDEHGNKGCPDGLVKKGIRAPCKDTVKDYIKSIRVPACKPMIRSYDICVLPPGAGTTSPPPLPTPTPIFEVPSGCVDVSTSGCKASKTCVEYKCKTREDMERVDETNVKLPCGKDTILKCRRFYEEPYENEVRCNCEEILPGDYEGKPCPDGLVVKNKRPQPQACVKPPCPQFMPGRPYDVCTLPEFTSYSSSL